MKKRFIILCLSLVLCGILSIGISCNNSSEHTHSFTVEKAEEKYLASAATCTQKARYYYSCSCGEKGTETFFYGETANHSFTNYVSDNNATYEKDGTKTAKCDYKDCAATDTIIDEGSMLKVSLLFKTLTANGDKVYGVVSNSTESFSFIKEVKYSENVTYVVSFDIYGREKIDTKTISLLPGDNCVYVTALLNFEPKAIYEVIIRRRPIYKVYFNTNGGSPIDNMEIEEDTLISEPTTTRIGYTFDGWNYDFSKPIIKNTTITARWSPNADTPYRVEYYQENINDDEYTLFETVDLQALTDTVATAEQKEYEHFTFNEDKSILNGEVFGDGSLVLKVYYTRNIYTLENVSPTLGEITFKGTKITFEGANEKYGTHISTIATEYLGCNFIGWYNDEDKLLSKDRQYDFIIDCDVRATFKPKDEMLNFAFLSAIDRCSIFGVRDKTVSEINIPEYVTTVQFGELTNLKSVTIPKASINNNAFYKCVNLTSVSIGSGVAYIGPNAFCGCSSLASIVIPSSVKTIEYNAFGACDRLEYIRYCGTAEQWDKIKKGNNWKSDNTTVVFDYKV